MEPKTPKHGSISRVKALGIRFLSAQVIALLLFGPYFASLCHRSTAYYLAWETRDAVHALRTVFLIALGWFLLDGLIRRLAGPLLVRILDHLYVVGLGAGLLANLCFYSRKVETCMIWQHGIAVQTAWLAMCTLVGSSLARPHSRLVQRCWQFCLILSPVVVIVPGQLLRQSTYPSPMDPLPPATPTSVVRASNSAERPTPIYLFVFDGWSYERTFENGVPREQFVNLTALSTQSVLFHDAHSPGNNTFPSMQGLLFQNELDAIIERRALGFMQDGEFIPAHSLPSLFSVVADKDYHTVLVGTSTPYKAWLGDQVDTCRSYLWHKYKYSDLTTFGMHALNAAAYWTDPWSRSFHPKWKKRLEDAKALRLPQDVNRDVLYFITQRPRNLFGLFHYPVPHWPYVFNEDGSYRTREGVSWTQSDVEGYVGNLHGVDRLAGECIEAIKRAGRFDDALIILTSDHTWRYDPDRKTGRIVCPKTHVPLLIKLPGQERPLSVTSRWETARLRSLIALALEPKRDAEAIVRLLGLAVSDAAEAPG